MELTVQDCELEAVWTKDEPRLVTANLPSADELAAEIAPGFEKSIADIICNMGCSREEAREWLSFAAEHEGLMCSRVGLVRGLYEMTCIHFRHCRLFLKVLLMRHKWN